ncbi:hypothetical protein PQX77_015238 [Marasmius sp. AFHP31]|nr:hypothetical protein PQX77_015238 [Marasmius sp. AFHP31]
MPSEYSQYSSISMVETRSTVSHIIVPLSTLPGYIYDNPRNWSFDHWVRQSPNVVIIPVYYRLDAFGSLTTPDFADSKNGDFNVGFLDQIQAPQWVLTHIETFGEDSHKVTINGESAGSGSVEHHLVANPLYENFASTAGCGTGDVKTKLARLRKPDVSTGSCTRSVFYWSLQYTPPCCGWKSHRWRPEDTHQAGKFAKVPLIVGAASNKTATGGTDVAVALKNSFPGLSDTDVQDILAVAPEANFASSSQRFQVITGESLLICVVSPLSFLFRLVNGGCLPEIIS